MTQAEIPSIGVDIPTPMDDAPAMKFIDQEVVEMTRIGGTYIEACETCGDPLVNDTDGCSCTPAASSPIVDYGPDETFSIVSNDDGDELATAPTYQAARDAARTLLEEEQASSVAVDHIPSGRNVAHVARDCRGLITGYTNDSTRNLREAA